jgi:hypothetical protein
MPAKEAFLNDSLLCQVLFVTLLALTPVSFNLSRVIVSLYVFSLVSSTATSRSRRPPPGRLWLFLYPATASS